MQTIIFEIVQSSESGRTPIGQGTGCPHRHGVFPDTGTDTVLFLFFDEQPQALEWAVLDQLCFGISDTPGFEPST